MVILTYTLLTLGDGKANVEQNAAIELPLTMDANSGLKVDAQMDYTLLIQWWDYLPTLAEG